MRNHHPWDDAELDRVWDFGTSQRFVGLYLRVRASFDLHKIRGLM